MISKILGPIDNAIYGVAFKFAAFSGFGIVILNQVLVPQYAKHFKEKGNVNEENNPNGSLNNIAGIFNNNKFVDKGLMYLDKGADYMQAPGLTKYGIPASQATGDVMFAQAKRDQDAYDDEMAAESEAEGASNAQRAAAIRQSMESYGFTEEEIEDPEKSDKETNQ